MRMASYHTRRRRRSLIKKKKEKLRRVLVDGLITFSLSQQWINMCVCVGRREKERTVYICPLRRRRLPTLPPYLQTSSSSSSSFYYWSKVHMEIEEPRVSAALNIRRMRESSSSSRTCAARRSPSQMKSQATFIISKGNCLVPRSSHSH